MPRSHFLFQWYVAAALIAAATSTGGDVASAAEKPLNVLFITADDLGLQLGCYGETLIETPHLDRLAKSGTRFDIAYVAQASCSPSRSAMFTGLHTHRNRAIRPDQCQRGI